MITLDNYIAAARILLQDTLAGAYRYSDDDMKLALEIALDEAYRIRPDMFIAAYGALAPAVSIIGQPGSYTMPIPRGYQSPFLYYMVGHVQLRDDEDTQDSRATALLGKFTAQLLAVSA